LSNSADLIIANSYAGRNEHVADGYPAGKTIVIPNGIDTTLFCPNQVSRTKIRLEWGVAEHEELVGLVGRLDPMKDHETFLRAAQLTSRSRKTARFVCVGDGRPEYRAALKERARLLGLSDRILWVGTRSDMTDVYNALDLLVSCSYGEGFSNVIGEAMACGVPCVVTNVGDSRFIVGEFGSAVEPKDTESLHLAIMRSLSDKHDSPGIRRRIVEQFSLQRLILATESELLSLCHQSAPSSVSPTHQTF